MTARAVTTYLNAQIAAGAQAAMIFDTWGGIPPRAYREFSLAYMSRIVAGLTREAEKQPVPVILFTKGGGAWLEDIAASGCDAVGVDWTVDLGDARRRVGARVALQATSTRLPCTPLPNASANKQPRCWPITVPDRATSSTSATAFSRASIQSMSECWSKRYTS